jgi:hypothetical protein
MLRSTYGLLSYRHITHAHESAPHTMKPFREPQTAVREKKKKGVEGERKREGERRGRTRLFPRPSEGGSENRDRMFFPRLRRLETHVRSGWRRFSSGGLGLPLSSTTPNRLVGPKGVVKIPLPKGGFPLELNGANLPELQVLVCGRLIAQVHVFPSLLWFSVSCPHQVGPKNFFPSPIGIAFFFDPLQIAWEQFGDESAPASRTVYIMPSFSHNGHVRSHREDPVWKHQSIHVTRVRTNHSNQLRSRMHLCVVGRKLVGGKIWWARASPSTRTSSASSLPRRSAHTEVWKICHFVCIILSYLC